MANLVDFGTELGIEVVASYEVARARHVCPMHMPQFLTIKLDLVRLSSGVGTVAAVAALAATLFRPQINIHPPRHNLL